MRDLYCYKLRYFIQYCCSRECYEIVLLEKNMIDNRKLKVYLDTSVISHLW